MRQNSVQFSIAKHAQWAPGLNSQQEWDKWLEQSFVINNHINAVPEVAQMPPMLRRRARLLGRMALEVAYACVDKFASVPTIFCSRHGEVAHSVEMINALISEGNISPIGFSSAVHNATAGLFSIARQDRSNHIALAAGNSTVEHAVIEACGLLNEGASAVLLVHYECPLPSVFNQFEDCIEQAYAWAWLLVPAAKEQISLSWSSIENPEPASESTPSGLQILRFHLSQQTRLERCVENKQWIWSRNDAIA